MKLLWICNMMPAQVRRHMGEAGGSGLWVDHVLSDLEQIPELRLHILCRGERVCSGAVNAQISYRIFSEPLPYVYYPELERLFAQELADFQPQVIHSWGVEYGHTLAMVNAAEAAGMKDKMVIGIQGLCSICAIHYTEGIPQSVLRSASFRDFLRRDNIVQQQKKFQLRGQMEVRALEQVSHVMGRTHWDRACTMQVNPDAQYHFCPETLRAPFYQGSWEYASCQKHRIFANCCEYPIKGFHYVLEAFAQIVKRWPDATLAVPGQSFLNCHGKEYLRQQTYHKYLAKLAKQYGLAERIEFLGHLSPEEMKQAYLEANVFVLSSTVENSPNAMGEAMLLGVPCVCADVGGVSSLLVHAQEGFLYPSTAPYMLAYYVQRVFTMGEAAQSLGAAARSHALKTHDPEENRRLLLAVYEQLAQEGLADGQTD